MIHMTCEWSRIISQKKDHIIIERSVYSVDGQYITYSMPNTNFDDDVYLMQITYTKALI